MKLTENSTNICLHMTRADILKALRSNKYGGKSNYHDFPVLISIILLGLFSINTILSVIKLFV
jgi:hypothetical protein